MILPNLRQEGSQAYHKFKMKLASSLLSYLFTFVPCFLLLIRGAKSTSINYGISQRPITDISQLMPSLCQNQSVICEGSFCIPGLRKCVCDLRQPVQFGRFCLRQVDIETKCFVTNQCNHTIKDAICLDTTSNAILDVETSRYKLEQWQHLNELRQASKSALSNQESVKQRVAAATNLIMKPMYFVRRASHQDELTYEARNAVIMSSYRNSPYEINYYTPELLHQNHTRRRTNSSSSSNNNGGDRMLDQATLNILTGNNANSNNDTHNDGSRQVSGKEKAISITGQPSSTSNLIQSIIAADQTTVSPSYSSATKATETEEQPTLLTTSSSSSSSTTTTATSQDIISSSPETNDLSKGNSKLNEAATTTTTAVTTTLSKELSKKKMTIAKTPNWPPGVCSCPLGYMFDSMLRKCLALSLADSHCQSDNDCKQIRLTHCSSETRKCECDEPLTWNQTELACQRPSQVVKTDIQATSHSRDSAGVLDSLIPPLLMAKIMPDQTMLLLIFVILVIICTLLLLRLIVKCFSSSNSALISPKNSKKRKAGENASGNILSTKSPYATLRKPEHKPSTPLASFTQAARGRILNYDFEQDEPIPSARSPQSPPQLQVAATFVAQREDQQHHHHHHYGTLERTGAAAGTANAAIKASSSGTLSRQKLTGGHKPIAESLVSNNHAKKTPDRPIADECLELNDNVSLGGPHDSESRSENTSVMAIPGPPPTQTPPYMLASAMKGQGSAIAAAAAAVANRRMQMAHKKGLAESSGKVTNGTPVFL